MPPLESDEASLVVGRHIAGRTGFMRFVLWMSLRCDAPSTFETRGLQNGCVLANCRKRVGRTKNDSSA